MPKPFSLDEHLAGWLPDGEIRVRHPYEGSAQHQDRKRNNQQHVRCLSPLALKGALA